MRILAHIHAFPPDHNAGAEWMAHDVLGWLQDRGHSVQVAVRDSSVEMFNEIPITTFNNGYDLFPWYDWADVVITHLDEHGRAVNLATHKKKPLVHLVHNTHSVSMLRVRKKNMYVAFNSQYTKKERGKDYAQHPQMVLRPPTFSKQYQTEPGEYITLIGLNENKGADVLRKVANKMPETDFLAVKGGYGKQQSDFPDNVLVIENTPDPKKIYSQTKILLVPSEYESWGRVAVEAMCSGIPVIASPTPGLKESCGNGAIFCERDNIKKWVEAINYVTDDWETWSDKALNRFNELDFGKDLIRFEEFLQDITNNKFEHNLQS